MIDGSHANKLILQPGLQLGNFVEAVGHLETLQLTDDLGGLHVLVEVDDALTASVEDAVAWQLACALIAGVDKC